MSKKSKTAKAPKAPGTPKGRLPRPDELSEGLAMLRCTMDAVGTLNGILGSVYEAMQAQLLRSLALAGAEAARAARAEKAGKAAGKPARPARAKKAGKGRTALPKVESPMAPEAVKALLLEVSPLAIPPKCVQVGAPSRDKRTARWSYRVSFSRGVGRSRKDEHRKAILYPRDTTARFASRLAALVRSLTLVSFPPRGEAPAKEG